MKRSLSIILILLSSFALKPQGFVVGATGQSGLVYPLQENQNIQLNKVIIDMLGFHIDYTEDHFPVPTARFKTLYQFKNTGDNYAYIPSSLPIKIYFTRFDQAGRSRIFDYLADIMPDLFNNKGSGQAILQHIQEQFGHRVFIRRYMNVEDLDKFNIAIYLKLNDKVIEIQKAIAEFRLLNDQEGNENVVLEMSLNLQFDIQLQPQGTGQLIMSYQLPAFDAGLGYDRYFESFFMGSGMKWAGNIDQVYLVYPALGASLTFPYYVDYTLQDLGFNQKVAILKNHKPEQFETIGFYHTEGAKCDCNKQNYSESVYWPSALKTITASSWLKTEKEIKNTCLSPIPFVTVGKWVPGFEEGNARDLSFMNDTLVNDWSDYHGNGDMISTNCKTGKASVSVNDYHNPIWAFDVAADSIGYLSGKEESHFNNKTSWCEGVRGQGINQYLEVEIIQPVDKIKFWTGNMETDEKYNVNSRVKKFVLTKMDSNFRKLLVFSDLHISTSFDEKLAAGKYRFTITDVYPGSKYQNTCFSGLQLSFTLEDSWFQEAYEILRKY